jgi:hypothetical protein
VRKLLLLLALSLPASAQCVMCFRTAKAQNAERARVMNLGILVLGAPPLLLFGGFVAYVVRRDRESNPDTT